MMINKIPKIIHWVWLSGDPLPEDIKECVDSWGRVMPDFKIMKWDKSNFDIESVPFVKSAYEHKKYATASDYVRLYALYKLGGVYFDSDVFALKSLEPFLKYDFFSSIEQFEYIMERDGFQNFINKDGIRIRHDKTVPGMGIQAAMLGSVKGHPLIKECLDFLGNQSFVQPDGSYFYKKMVAPALIATFAEGYGFKYTNIHQRLSNGIEIFPAHDFFGVFKGDINQNTYAEHRCAGSWQDKPSIYRRILNKLKKVLMHF